MSPAIDRARLVTALAAGGLLGGLGLALDSGVPSAVAVAVAGLGALVGLAVLVPAAIEAVRRNRALTLVIVVIGLVAAWVLTGLDAANTAEPGIGPVGPAGSLGQASEFSFGPSFATPATGWPWRIGHTSPLALVGLVVCVVVGTVLLSDAVRVGLGLEPTQRVPWRLLTTPLERRGRVAWRVLPGFALIGTGVLLAIGVADSYLVGDPTLQSLAAIGVSALAAMLVIAPLLVGALMRTDRDKAGHAREEERQRFAAHLHDSVLQTLALVQRQAHDPAAVIRLARRQEYALRAWMAGEAELVSETLAAALREVVAGVEDEHGITIELTAIGDRALDARGEALVAAAREALRNAARHGGGAPVNVFCEIAAGKVEVFVRDDGPGFDPGTVGSERRGIRDAVIGRMAVVGGRASIESVPGEGTEVALAL